MKTKDITLNALIICIYTALTLVLPSLSYGMIQLRVAEVLMVLCLYRSDYIISLTLACFFSNMLGIIMGINPMPMDIVFGSMATLISGILIYSFRNIRTFKKPVLSLLMPGIINGLIIGFELSHYLNEGHNLLLYALYVFVGESLVTVVLGLLLERPFSKLNDYFEKQ